MRSCMQKILFDIVGGLCWDENVLFVCSALCAPTYITQSIPVKTVMVACETLEGSFRKWKL